MGRLYPGKDPPAPGSTEGGARVIASGEGSGGPGPFVMASATLAGDAIVNARGEKLGTLEHVMIDVASGHVAYAVLARGGLLGADEKLFAIPWVALTLDAPAHRFVLDIDADRLDKAPGFDRDHWPAMADPRWSAQVYDYFGLAPGGVTHR